MPNIEIHRADPQELRDVLRVSMATGEQTAAELEAQVTLLIQYARELGLDLSCHWWCEIEGERRCACSRIVSPGRTAMLLLPGGRLSGMTESDLAEFIATVVEEPTDDALSLLQCLTTPEDMVLSASLRRAGFQELALLKYMEAVPSTEPTDSWRQEQRNQQLLGEHWVTYSDKLETDLARLITATYEGSQDCPLLTGMRRNEDIIAGYKAAGRFDRERWLMLADGAGFHGCILLAENPLRPVLEVVYMGVHPRSRHRGVGRRLLAQGLELAHREGITRVTLAVDDRNDPALALYRAAGFRETMRRRAFIRALPTSFRRTRT